MKVNNVVYSRKYNSIGIILNTFDKGELRTDADGMVYSGDLLLIKSKDQLNQIINATDAEIAPSTMNLINNLNLL